MKTFVIVTRCRKWVCLPELTPPSEYVWEARSTPSGASAIGITREEAVENLKKTLRSIASLNDDVDKWYDHQVYQLSNQEYAWFRSNISRHQDNPDIVFFELTS